MPETTTRERPSAVARFLDARGSQGLLPTVTDPATLAQVASLVERAEVARS